MVQSLFEVGWVPNDIFVVFIGNKKGVCAVKSCQYNSFKILKTGSLPACSHLASKSISSLALEPTSSDSSRYWKPAETSSLVD